MKSGATAAELVAAIQCADRAAEAELVSRYHRGVRVILRRSVNHQEAEDLAQEVLLLAIEKIRRGEVREPESLSGFISGLARNLAISHLRKAHQAEAAVSQLRETEDRFENPLRKLLRREEQGVITEALAGMSSLRDRNLLDRFYLKEEPKDRICADFGLSELHFNRVLFRARERFRKLYGMREERATRGV